MKSVILGSEVSRYARSPVIWNYLYSYLQLPYQMAALDASSTSLPRLMGELISKGKTSCGLIAAPLKDDSYWFRSKSSKAVSKSRSANFFAVLNNGDLQIENFDGQACIKSIQNNFPRTELNKVAIIGTGPVARIVATELTEFLKNKSLELYFFSRNSTHQLKEWATDFQFHVLPRESLSEITAQSSLVINCSPLGSPREKGLSVSRSEFHAFSSSTVFFDVKYGPEKSESIKIATELHIPNVDGKEMNLLQAAMAFKRAHNTQLEVEEICNLLINQGGF
jgi:shikimate 5-dehydrogenase